MNLSNYVTSKILPLEGFEGNLFTSQDNNIMKSGFLMAGTENFGYFRINLSADCIGAGKKDKSRMFWWFVAAIITVDIAVALPIPLGENRYNLCAVVEILDINMKVLKKYSGSDMCDLPVTIYDDDYTFKTESIYRNLLKACLLAASRDSDEINAALISAKMNNKIPKGSRIALIGSNQTNDVIHATRRIEAQFIDSQKFQIVDRANIDVLIVEQIFSRSVFVSDAIEVGRMLSVHYIIFVEITGEGANRTINYKVLYVETGEVITNFASLLI
jgi:hypothetical protein